MKREHGLQCKHPMCALQDTFLLSLSFSVVKQVTETRYSIWGKHPDVWGIANVFAWMNPSEVLLLLGTEINILRWIQGSEQSRVHLNVNTQQLWRTNLTSQPMVQGHVPQCMTSRVPCPHSSCQKWRLSEWALSKKHQAKPLRLLFSSYPYGPLGQMRLDRTFKKTS